MRYFGAGLLLGAVLVAFVAGVVGAVPQALVPAPVRWALLGAAALAVLARECGLLAFRVPENARLVPEDVQHLREWGALQFGFEMGTGMRTYSPSALPHLVLLAVVLVVPFPAAFAVAAGFAAGRLAMPLLSHAWSDDGAWTAVWDRTQARVRPVLALTVVVALAGIMLGA
ncbi:hypothetical protein I4I73_15065 [Pseudonocardia sp. KRD-184]|uniref:Uncharacterized protein n=1 Tax=Pseudonocardia oceani TaxID=2792013 RepID=A0ABS6U4J2_9PSEU|nr:hypothetical protein [Pseudonocardia oceani]MBW0090137.1 hypothetical protein [Pseudonocardia oceani]MBW0097305.1 hypothetical protein [Pseudonocardia oceani]MBW0109993.1 hypothetical protein [Pseudonocardia oceani]MBW0124051.1 hypothetical protein [Pseudonocardia oceani]MBW0127143.1 hypothetical protein [Pseudonocardia oceani]